MPVGKILGRVNSTIFQQKESDIMTDQNIYDLACLFKTAMLNARDEGLFNRDDTFCHFPRGCCGHTCYLLATFLKSYGIETLYVWGDHGFQSHAWLVVSDDRVRKPTTRYIEIEEEYANLLSQYGREIDGPTEITRYKARDLTNGLVVDITADQFGEPSVYVGKRNDFYRRYTFRDAHICEGVSDGRLSELYRNISWFLPR